MEFEQFLEDVDTSETRSRLQRDARAYLSIPACSSRQDESIELCAKAVRPTAH